eukprot:1144155-Pelagomonas_calceolata.AAC.2
MLCGERTGRLMRGTASSDHLHLLTLADAHSCAYGSSAAWQAYRHQAHGWRGVRWPLLFAS